MSQQPNVGEAVDKARRFSPAMFGIIAICFLLPFVAVTCSSQELFELSGLQLVTGTEVGQDDLGAEFREGFNQLEEGFGGETTETTGSEDETEIPAEPAAIAALALALIGLVAGFALKNDKGPLLSAVIGILGVVALIALRVMFKVEDPSASAEELAQAETIIGYKWGLGWWLAFLLFLVQPLLHLSALKRLAGRDAGSTAPPAASPPPSPPQGTGDRPPAT